MSKRWMACVALGATAGLAMGQVGFTITDGDSSYGIAASGLGAPGGNINRTGTGGGFAANFLVDGSATDHLFQNWWWYRVGNGTREHAFSNFVSQSSGGANNHTLNYAEVDGVSASINYVIQDPGVGAIVTQRVVLTNTSTAGPQTVNLFNYADFDVGGTAGSDSAVMTGANLMRITDVGGSFAEFEGVGASAFQVTGFATLRTLLSNAVVDNLNNTGLPFGPGDWTGAFQWSFTLNPGESVTVIERLSVNTAVPTPGAAALLGLGGLAGLRRRR